MGQTIAAIDISAYQHPTGKPIDWYAVRRQSDKEAVYIQATYGVDGVNPWAEQDANGAHAQGLHVGYYHFAYPSESSPSVQAQHHWNVIKNWPRDIGSFLDMENASGIAPGPEAAAWGAYYLDDPALKDIGHKGLYTDDYWLSNLPGAPWGHLLWLAQTANPRRPVWAWQQTTPSLVAGIVGPCDTDTLYLP